MALSEGASSSERSPDATDLLDAAAASIHAVIEGRMNRFAQCLSVLNDIAARIRAPIAIVGGLAAIHHGARVTTLDVDVVLAGEDAEALLAEGPRLGVRVKRKSPRGWHQLVFEHEEGDVDIHVIPGGSRGPRDPDDAPPIPGPQELGVSSGLGYASFAPWVVMKLVCGRDKDRYHLVEVLKSASESDVAEAARRLRALPPRYLEELQRLARDAEDEKQKDGW
ncbi:MAG: hypothetical protein JXA90_16845 [Planctomycetes bacterium]|nr:hypothetical protein [Planctomycetota bacterium]